MEDLFFLHFSKTGETGSEKVKEKKNKNDARLYLL